MGVDFRTRVRRGIGCLLTAVTIFALYLTGSTYWAIVQDAVPRENVGGVGGFVHGLANCSPKMLGSWRMANSE